MAKTADQIIADVSAEVIGKINKETEDARLFVLDTAEVYLSVGSNIREVGNGMRKAYRGKTADPQLTKHK